MSHVIFNSINSEPFDNGAMEYFQVGRLPKYINLILERAKVIAVGIKVLISLLIKLDNHTRVEPENIKNCIVFWMLQTKFN